MRSSRLCLFFVCFAGLACAQSKPAIDLADTQIQMNSAFRELSFKSLTDGSADTKLAASQKAEIEFQRRLFYEKSKHFVDLWTKMTAQINERNIADINLARKVARAFHDLEKSEGWPVRDRK